MSNVILFFFFMALNSNLFYFILFLTFSKIFYFIFKLYIIVLVLPNIKMNPPQVPHLEARYLQDIIAFLQ